MRKLRNPTALLYCLAAAGCADPSPSPVTVTWASSCTAGARDGVAEKLSETGCFEADDPSQPVAGLLPFSPNAPSWTDGADKARWMSIPAGKTIAFDDRGDFILPVGTVLIKNFTVEGRLVETRILMHHVDGWRGYPYQWNADGTDAVLAMDGAQVPGAGIDGSAWTIPSSGSCSSCHTSEANVAMGLEIAQLNGPLDHPGAEPTDNQLEELEAMGVLQPLTVPVDTLPALVDPTDTTAPLEDRARAYLHANCSSCHTSPDDICSGDLRWTANLQQMGVCDVEPKIPMGDWGPDAMLLSPGAPERSAILLRLGAQSDSGIAMPPLGRDHVDDAGVTLIREWIASLQDCE